MIFRSTGRSDYGLRPSQGQSRCKIMALSSFYYNYKKRQTNYIAFKDHTIGFAHIKNKQIPVFLLKQIARTFP